MCRFAIALHGCQLAVRLSVVTIFLGTTKPTSATYVSDRHIVKNLFHGNVALPNNVVLTGDQHWENASGDQRQYAYYGYKFGKAGRFEVNGYSSQTSANFDVYDGRFIHYMVDPNRLKLGPACQQGLFDVPGMEVLYANRNLTFDEDCLYLDVYVPPVKIDHEKKWPVLLWIYGGSFKMGDKDKYNSSFLARSVDAIVVTVNYRLSVFGFLSTEDGSASGNWAIGDLKLALNWTLDNIASFNGDPSKITVFGVSAGGALTSALMLDNYVRSKVFAAVSMSGTMLSSWAVTQRPANGTKKLGTSLGCPVQSTAATVECLRRLSPAALLNATYHVLEDGKDSKAYFGPTVGDQHIPKDPQQILKERVAAGPPSGRVGTYITGFLADESSYTLFDTPQLLNASFSLEIVSQLLTGFVASVNTACPENIPVQVERILSYYNLTNRNTPDELRKGYFRATTDVGLGIGTIMESMLYASADPLNNQMYFISYDPGFSGIGAFHTMDVLHLFRGWLDVYLKEKMSEALTSSLHDYYRRVAHNGRADGPAFGSSGHYRELTQEAIWVERRRNFTPLVEFWQHLFVLPCTASTTFTTPSLKANP